MPGPRAAVKALREQSRPHIPALWPANSFTRALRTAERGSRDERQIAFCTSRLTAEQKAVREDP